MKQRQGQTFLEIGIFIADGNDVGYMFFCELAHVRTVCPFRFKGDFRMVAVPFEVAGGRQKGKPFADLSVQVGHIQPVKTVLRYRYFFHTIIVCRKAEIIYRAGAIFLTCGEKCFIIKKRVYRIRMIFAEKKREFSEVFVLWI